MTEALFNTEDVIEVNDVTLSDLKDRAAAAPRGRFRLCLHHGPADPVQEMVIACGSGTYFRPHRHPAGKSESYHIIEGEMTVYLFDDNGQVVRRIRMGDKLSGKTFYYRLSAPLWHLPLATSNSLVYGETYCGPFLKDGDVEYASWSPTENSPDVSAYLTSLEAGAES